MTNLNSLTEAIVGAAIEVHQRLGPGLLETAYRKCPAYELRQRDFEVIEEQPIPVVYDEVHLECGFRADLLINGSPLRSPHLCVSNSPLFRIWLRWSNQDWVSWRMDQQRWIFRLRKSSGTVC